MKLGNRLYLWNACIIKVTNLCDMEIDDMICLVGLAQHGTHRQLVQTMAKFKWRMSCCRPLAVEEQYESILAVVTVG
ncbi:B-type cell cycle switch protein ccs52A-like isoform X1 [Beta vulgaris subsp. vulgaris]|uniref:B-type cell cycle switch protein ccs52A-like isoform X1 n=1 Tax=Beta vulgaris subsp. vulgaris TaxID=3555 RepID=UPI0025483552|nr:B-type cell cycle switch protein ccs52A-like isoform X1 [Beta vulgaris subsp. vulgaris]